MIQPFCSEPLKSVLRRCKNHFAKSLTGTYLAQYCGVHMTMVLVKVI